MKQKSVMNLLIALSMLLAFSGVAQSAGDAVAAKEKLSMCEGCHGIPNYKTAFPTAYHVPKLGGQHADYIVKALEGCLLYTSPSPRDRTRSRMPSSA